MTRPFLLHLARGVAGFGLAGLGVWLLASPGALRPVGALMLPAAAVLLRGCPACWLAGLFDNLRSAAPEKSP